MYLYLPTYVETQNSKLTTNNVFFLSSQFLEFRIEIGYGLLYLIGLAGHESHAMEPDSQPLQFFYGTK